MDYFESGKIRKLGRIWNVDYFDIVAPPLTLTKTVPKSHQSDTWGLFHSYIGHISTLKSRDVCVSVCLSHIGQRGKGWVLQVCFSLKKKLNLSENYTINWKINTTAKLHLKKHLALRSSQRPRYWMQQLDSIQRIPTLHALLNLIKGWICLSKMFN